MNPHNGLFFDLKTENCFAFKSDVSILSCNRVCNTIPPSKTEIGTIKEFFKNVPFTWVINKSDTITKDILEENGFHHKASFPALSLNLNALHSDSFANELIVKQINLQDQLDINTWISISSEVFSVSQVELIKMVEIFKQRIPAFLKLYVAYYNTSAVAAGMMILHESTATLHWIGTLPKFRNKGLGSAVTYQALLDALNYGCKRAILMATVLGRPLYENLGFTEYAAYDIYSTRK